MKIIETLQELLQELKNTNDGIPEERLGTKIETDVHKLFKKHLLRWDTDEKKKIQVLKPKKEFFDQFDTLLADAKVQNI